MCSAIGAASALPVTTAGSIAFAVRIPEAGAVFGDVTVSVSAVISSSSSVHVHDNEDQDGDHDQQVCADDANAPEITSAAERPGSSATG